MVNDVKSVKIEVFNTKKGKKQYVVARRSDGTIDQRRPIAGTRAKGLFIKDFRELYKSQNSLYEGRVRHVRSNVIQVSLVENVRHTPIVEKTPADIKKMSKKEKKAYNESIKPARDRAPMSRRGIRGKAHYYVSAWFEGKYYISSSKFIGAKAEDGYVYPDSANAQACKQSAYDGLYMKISALAGTYDADEGLKLVQNNGLSKVKEGWIFYTKRSNK